ncbi:PAS domain S-box protein [Desulfobacula phenolica]|uniref:PAS domain S-box-containing protein n=1 Tax=Desulfobacula phenolica TaxID=90732 RepID=A0A1H2E3N5_9BACT|nr:transporter substrate-binding domain-containing protein [Desulfobacula phenolica]SDT89318.1 PAS domain S-box-containing protein [Desulfobacula phenolica]
MQTTKYPMLYSIICLTILFISFPSQARTEHFDSISVVYCQDWKPFEFQGEDGNPAGMIIDHWKLWSEKTGIQVDYRPASQSDALAMVRTGKVDAHAGLFYSNERDNYLLYGSSLNKTDRHVFFHQSLAITHDQDIMPYRVGVLTDDYLDDYLQKMFPDLAVVGYVDYAAMMADIHEGRLLVFAADILTGLDLLQKNDLTSAFHYNAHRPLWQNDWFVAVPEGRQTTLDVINRGMALITLSEKRYITRHWMASSNNSYHSTLADKLGLSEQQESWIRHNPTVTVAATPDWPPFEFLDSGDYKGLHVDILRLAAQKAGLKIKPVFDNWTNLTDQLKKGALDLCPGLTVTDERKKYLVFTDSVSESWKVMITRIRDTVESLDDLEGLTVTVEQGYSTQTFLKNNFPGIKLLLVDNTLSAIKAVITGRANAYIGNQAAAFYQIKQNSLSGLKATAFLEELKQERYRIGVIKSKPLLRGILQKALVAITAEERMALQLKWFGVTMTGKVEKTDLKLTDAEQNWLKEHPRIRIGIMHAWPPMNYVDEQGNPEGIGVDYINAINSRLKISLIPVPGPFKENVALVKEKQLDAVMDITPKKEREPFLNFSKPYLKIPHVIVGRDNGQFFNSENDLTGKTVALESGFYNVTYFRKNHPDITIKEYDITSDALDAVSRGKADAYAGNRAVVNYLIKQELMNNLQVQGRMEKPPVILSIGVRKDWPELVTILNKVLDAVTPEMDVKFKNKWVSLTFEDKTDMKTIVKWVVPVFSVLGLIIIVFIAWNRRLGREIFERKAAETKIRAMSDASHDAMIMIKGRDEGEGEVMFWNSAAETMFGYTSDETLGKRMHTLFVPEQFRQPVHEGLKRFFKTGQGPVIGGVMEQTALRRDGTVFPVEIAVSSFQLDHEWYAVGSVRDITERKISERRIKVAQEELLLIFDNSQVGILFMQNDCEIVRINQRMVDILDYNTPKQMIGLSMSRLHLSDEYFQSFKKERNKVLVQGKQSRGEYQLCRKDGSVVWCSLTGKAVDTTVPPDLSVGVIWVVEDITRRKKMEDKLKRSEENFRIIADYTYGWESWHNAEGLLLWANPAVERITGYSVDECMNMENFPDPFVHIEDRHYFEKLKKKALAGEVGKDVSFRIIQKTTGNEIWATIAWNPVHDEDGLIKGFRTSVRDMTEHKIAEEKLKAKERRFRAYFQNSLVGITITHPDKDWIEVNNKFLEMTGYSREELEDFSWEELCRSEDLKTDLENYDGMLAGNLDNYFMDKRFLKKDGSFIYTKMAVSYVRNDHDEVEMILAFYIDITESKKAEKAMEQHVKDLEQFNRLTISREERMIELKDEINNLLLEMGHNQKYKIR